MIYTFFVVGLEFGAIYTTNALSSLAWYLSYHSNWFEVLHVLEFIPVTEWDYDLYRLAIRSHLRKRPRDIVSAQSLLLKSQAILNLSLIQKTQLKLFYESNVQSECWEDCRVQFESAKNKVLETPEELPNQYSSPPLLSFFATPLSCTSKTCTNKHKKLLELGSAMIDICITYKQFDYGWTVYEELMLVDKHTLRVVMNLCQTAVRSSDSLAESIPDTIKWEGRAWTVYIRAKNVHFPDGLSRILPQVSFF